MKLNKSLIISSSLFLLTILLMPAINYYFGREVINSYLNSKYLVHFIAANTDITIEQITNSAIYIILIRDGFIIISSALCQFLFVLTIFVLIKRKKGLINYLLSLLFAILSFSGIAALIYSYNTLGVEQSFFTYQTYILLVIAIINFIIYLIFSYYFIKSRYNAIMPLTEQSIFRFIYSILKIAALLIVVLSFVALLGTMILEQFITAVVSKINIEDFLNLPAVIRINLISTLESSNDNFTKMINNLTYKQGLFEILNGELIIQLSNLSTSIQQFINSYVEKYYDLFVSFTFKYFIVYIVLQLLNYIHKNLEFKNIISMLLLVATTITIVVYVPHNNITLLIVFRNLALILVLIYTLIFIDGRIGNYKVTRRLCNYVNNFKINESLSAFAKFIQKEFSKLIITIKNYFSKVKQNKKPSSTKSKNSSKEEKPKEQATSKSKTTSKKKSSTTSKKK